jgi:serine/threonine-protein kinase
MSPEPVKDAARAWVRSDIYSIGAVLYEMVTGRKLFEGDSSFAVMQAQVENAPVPPVRINPAIPQALNDAILTALEKDPARRFADADAFCRALEPPAHPVALVATKKPEQGRWTSPMLALAGTCTVVVLAMGFHTFSSRSPAAKVRPVPAPRRQPVAQTAPPMQAPAPQATQPIAPAPPPVQAAGPPAKEPVTPPAAPRIAHRTPKRKVAPAMSHEEPAAVPPTPAAPATALAPPPALKPSETPPPAVSVTTGLDSTAASTTAGETPIAGPPAQAEPDTPKEKKHGRFRRALGKIFSPNPK